MGASFFANYEIQKISFDFYHFQNGLIFLLLGLITILSKRKSTSDFLGREQTDQLKGLAIILVVVGHLWVHVSANKAIPVLGDYAVTLFLILSGFGLVRSTQNTSLTVGFFLSKRMKRVMIPYWVVTILILAGDYILLNRSYSPLEIGTTMAGINLTKTLHHLDYTRWYITILVIFYFIFLVAYLKLSGIRALIILFISSVALIILRLLNIFPLGAPHQLIAFPLGCLLATYYTQMHLWLKKSKRHYIVLLLSTICIVAFSWLICLFNSNPLPLLSDSLHKFSPIALNNIQALIFCFWLILFFGQIGWMGYKFSFLSFLGGLSYEIYLIHGPLLIKYNPIVKLLPSNFIVVSFLMFFVVVLWLSYLLNKSLYSLVAK